MRPGHRTVLAVLTVLAFGALAGMAHAGTGTFGGAVTPTDCGPMHDVTVASGDTTIDAVAAEYVPANDIPPDPYDPSGTLVVHGDTATSPESVHYANAALTPGTWHVQVCPFPGGLATTPYDYTGSWTTSNIPAPTTVPGSGQGGTGSGSIVSRVA